ncbi:MAG: glucose-6-phosphate isomerase [Flavobacteriaceae bacterium]|jgi:glucose-6-phosphate isomerase|nr:glucose-6-phosphate isomerase [Flavobacteriaceae bacterium]MBT6706260.1 glucose-6-phosphate isomerase [Flavobacteriaceae bacterium]|tara:strand:- start:6642 stop:8141 length:1500 start_codon:yes stop_codon:yes gene_type:complete
MNLPSINPTTTEAWNKLQTHFSEINEVHMMDLFKEDKKRVDKMNLSWKEFQVDFSKNRITDKTISLLLELAEELGLKEAIELQFEGSKINQTEDRAVLHTALRDFHSMKPEVKKSLQKMKKTSNAVIKGTWKGFTGKPITDIVNIGIGGSELGPKMVTNALKYYSNDLKIHYISNVDGDHVSETLKKLNRETTLFIIVSKSFTTQETMTNANAIKNWFLQESTQLDIEKHFIAVSSNESAVIDFGISEQNVFPMWDWVGGRFSLWSAVGLSTCCAIGYKNFEELLRGAHEMDLHFRNEDFSENIPVVLALLSVWYNNFFLSETEAIIPYTQYLEDFVPFLQQAIMESNGKSVDRNGNTINYQTGTIVWGNVGANAQHAFFQLLHQGTKLVPVDFIGFSESLYHNKKQHEILKANFFSQSEALLQGTYKQSISNAYRAFSGNKPSNTILINNLTPKNLGSLIAIYEHKIFVQGIIWNIFSFDQWGVELGKKLTNKLLGSL